MHFIKTASALAAVVALVATASPMGHAVGPRAEPVKTPRPKTSARADVDSSTPEASCPTTPTPMMAVRPRARQKALQGRACGPGGCGGGMPMGGGGMPMGAGGPPPGRRNRGPIGILEPPYLGESGFYGDGREAWADLKGILPCLNDYRATGRKGSKKNPKGAKRGKRPASAAISVHASTAGSAHARTGAPAHGKDAVPAHGTNGVAPVGTSGASSLVKKGPQTRAQAARARKAGH